MPVYFLHFDRPIHHARHYLGYSANRQTLGARLHLHRNGRSRAKIMKALHAAEIEFQIAKIWPLRKHDRYFERALKDRRDLARYCPLCFPEREAALERALARITKTALRLAAARKEADIGRREREAQVVHVREQFAPAQAPSGDGPWADGLGVGNDVGNDVGSGSDSGAGSGGGNGRSADSLWGCSGD